MSKTYVADKGTLDSVNSKVGTSGDSGSTSVFAKLNGIANTLANHVAVWTNARAGYLDNINTKANNVDSRLTAARAGYLDYLANGTYGLSAIKNEVTAAKNAASNVSVLDNTIGYGDIRVKTTGNVCKITGKGFLYTSGSDIVVTIDGNKVVDRRSIGSDTPFTFLQSVSVDAYRNDVSTVIRYVLY